MLTNKQLNFINSLPDEYKENARGILEETQTSWYNMLNVSSSALEERDKLQLKLKAKYNRRLEQIALQILNGRLLAVPDGLLLDDYYSNLIKGAICVAKKFIKEIDKANHQ